MIDESAGQASFQAHVELLQSFLAHRTEIVEKLGGVLNAQRKPIHYLQDRALLSRHIEDCFFTPALLTSDQRRLRGQLEEAHWASGFWPRQEPGQFNDLIHPAELTVRGFHCWQQTRWPGRNGRVRYAHTVFNFYFLRCLTLLSMRMWNAGFTDTAAPLAQIQRLLDELWKGAPADQPVLVRDARWLIPLAQSPTTDELAAYFKVAEHVAEHFSPGDATEVQKAHVRMLGGHLTSQTRYYCTKDDLSIDEESVVRRTRTSNTLDFGLLIQHLAPLLAAYEQACSSGDTRNRLELAGAILQGVSPDPELFLQHADLLGAYSMIEYLFIGTDANGKAEYTPMGQRHLRQLAQYAKRIGRALKPLLEDCPHCRPVEGAYSPFGAIFGNPANLAEFMALRTLTRDAVANCSLEDVFVDGDTSAEKLAWANSWRKLPHIAPEVQKLYDYPHQFAKDIFARIERTLSNCVNAGEGNNVARTGRLVVQLEDDPHTDSGISPIPDLPVRYIQSSDKQIVAAQKAISYDQSKLLSDRLEGHFIVSYQTSGGWVAIKKDILTEVLGTGQDARIAGAPREAAAVLKLMCPGMVTDRHVQAR